MGTNAVLVALTFFSKQRRDREGRAVVNDTEERAKDSNARLPKVSTSSPSHASMLARRQDFVASLAQTLKIAIFPKQIAHRHES